MKVHVLTYPAGDSPFNGQYGTIGRLELKREAARQGRTMSEMVETALRLLLRSQPRKGKLPRLPKFDSGDALANISDRDALYDAMERRNVGR